MYGFPLSYDARPPFPYDVRIPASLEYTTSLFAIIYALPLPYDVRLPLRYDVRSPFHMLYEFLLPYLLTS